MCLRLSNLQHSGYMLPAEHLRSLTSEMYLCINRHSDLDLEIIERLNSTKEVKC